ncbi:5-carboxymethyl-2-hydroxymuconate Delta-isomerase [Pseudomonas putida]|uniref:5-carboxymethyl-2-hydroxymuconate Delta-isomerase n=1 Tax=Pseudomonas putida TaxID=303 RepID=A0A7W2QJQ0_PSEPU|nr:MULTISPECIES: 5-carboxymethyl-2-hydroxymuconate Delta-isomerase [Pseudomonas]MBA6117133.1 5-carboxymethyl-2-hydroxymuconate Delta-isomerase [Pseudomonas putida]MBI6944562.1 5-carboxymethyl-2-hydroxymuconate Delta-isomerase [Pseudomonas putida]MBI6960860.1 5-carboxymethyl-2-hydroxymuconate Delta-isomerase [Pseudomonas putida]MCZ9638606.1 5-carboxymethyl-2-hydroxymuconate Delta-isomerase [Pseudomonas putida]MEC4878345.1 5-carboxymethyl-2-hydroxymuconate Delta-isomerase [Pseudomonas sp. NC26]
MPHLNLEYSDNLKTLNVDVLLLRLNHALVGSGQFADEADIKSRAQAFSHYRVGTAPGERAFAHVRLAILSGRSPEVKKQLSASLLEVLREAAPEQDGVDIQLCVEILDMDREPYAKLRLPG